VTDSRLLAIGLMAGAVLSVCAQTTRTVWDGVYTDEQAKRGEALYSTNCASCHGTDLTGGESAPPLSGIEFFSNWGGLSVGELFERIRVSMPLNRPGRLSREQNADIVSFVLKANRFPAGEAELARQAEVLNLIRLEAYRPEPAK
jgi:S-disulfanyl-L-cysteine oxidoreductase SoxD